MEMIKVVLLSLVNMFSEFKWNMSTKLQLVLCLMALTAYIIVSGSQGQNFSLLIRKQAGYRKIPHRKKKIYMLLSAKKVFGNFEP